MIPINLPRFKSWLLKHFGKPCKTTNLRCYKCRWWNAYYHLDAIMEEYQETEEYWQGEEMENMKEEVDKFMEKAELYKSNKTKVCKFCQFEERHGHSKECKKKYGKKENT